MVLRYTKLINDIRLVKLRGRVDTLASVEIEPRLAACCATDHARVIVDMTDVEYLSSFGIRILVRGARNAANRGGRMYIAGARPHIKDKLEITGISLAIQSYDTVAAAEYALLTS